MTWVLRSFLIVSLLCPAVGRAQEFGGEIGEPPKPDNRAAIDALVRLTRDQDATVRMTAFNSIARIGEETPEVIEVIQSGLKDDDVRVRVESFMALTSAVNDGKVKVDSLLSLIEDENEQLALKASEQLGRLGESAVPHLIEELKNEKTRVLIVRTLGSLGSNARESIPALSELLKSDDASLRALVAASLGEICGPPRRTTPGFSSRSSTSRGPDAATLQRMVDSIWPRYDADGDGKLSAEEQARISSLDPSADADGDKEISREELTRWFQRRYADRGGERFGTPRSPTPFDPSGGARP